MNNISITDKRLVCNSDISKRRRAFGHDLLGPVVAEYLNRLAGYIRFFDEERRAKPLFVSRAGIRIRRALETYLSTTGLALPASIDNFWISRLMVAKGTWNRNRNNAIDVFTREFSCHSLREFIEAMYRYEGVPKTFPLGDRCLKEPANDLAMFFNGKSAPAKALAAYFHEQSRLFERYLGALLDGHEMALLIDTGWAGTAQRLLADAYPDIEWWGAYFGRYGFAHTDRKYWRNMIGLVFEQDAYEFHKPETSTILNRHMIEDLFEPRGGSIERLALAGENVFAPEAAEVLADAPDEANDPIFMGVLDYLAELPDGASPAVLHRAARAAWRELSRVVALPSRGETRLFSNITRSADFGRTLQVPLLLPPEARHADDTPEQRIRDAQWQPGQAAIEYPSEIAEPLQRKLAGLDRLDFKQRDKKPLIGPKVRSRPAVAVITRTLDRPMFLKRALESVAGQTFRDYVHVVVNDGGDIDLARKTIEATVCAQHKIVLVDNVVNRGMEAASNIAIREVDSDYVVIHDDDDTWEPAFLEKAVAFLDGPKRCTYGGVITQSTYVSEEVTAGGIRIHGRDRFHAWVESVHIMEMAIQNFFPPIAFLYRRDIYDRIGGYNEDFPVLGDWDFNLRFLVESDIGMVHEPLANYHHRDRGDTSLFGNSVIAGRDKHMEYAAVVRNRFARNMLHADQPALAVLVGMGLHFDANRQAIRDIQSRVRPPVVRPSERDTGKVGSPNGDDYWVAMNRYRTAVERHDFSVLRHVGGGVTHGLKRLFVRPFDGDNGAPLTRQAIRYLTVLRKKGYELEPPPDFDEESYLDINPDVAVAVEGGELKSGFDHYYRYGRAEGRHRPTQTVG